jgi:hypothetical protein
MKTYVATIYCDEEGGAFVAHVGNNKTIESFPLVGDSVTLPTFLTERLALLRLCEPSKQNEGETFGRRLTDSMFHVYLSKTEFDQLKKLSRSAK